MKTLTVFYFSGTGNTRYIAEYLTGRLAAEYKSELCDITRIGDAAERLRTSDLLLLAFPIYGSSPPIPMREFVHRYGALWRGKRLLLAETQYFYSGDGAASLGRTLEKYGGVVVGAEMFNMPNNLSDCRLFPIKNGKELDGTLTRARKRADRFAARILQGKAKRRGFSLLAHGVGYFTQRGLFRRGETKKRDRLRIDPEKCVGCGLCAERCPVGNLRMEQGRPHPLGRCVLCYRCVNLCPRRAIALLGAEPPQTQYKGPGPGGVTS